MGLSLLILSSWALHVHSKRVRGASLKAKVKAMGRCEEEAWVPVSRVMDRAKLLVGA